MGIGRRKIPGGTSLGWRPVPFIEMHKTGREKAIRGQSKNSPLDITSLRFQLDSHVQRPRKLLCIIVWCSLER